MVFSLQFDQHAHVVSRGLSLAARPGLSAQLILKKLSTKLRTCEGYNILGAES